MKTYLDGLRQIMEHGTDILGERTGVGRRKIFGHQMRFNLQAGFPIVTTKRVYEKAVFHELIWLLSGNTNIEYLVQNDVRIWTEWPYQQWLKANDQEAQFPKYTPEWAEKMKEFSERIKTDHTFAVLWGELGRTYGAQWRNFGATKQANGTYANDGVDQITQAVDLLKNDPKSTRIIVTGWHAREAIEVALPPCHTLFQFNTVGDKLICHLYMRSADAFLGVPFNIASYAALTHMMAQVTGLVPHELIVTFNDFHIYLNQIEQVQEQLSREPFRLPKLELNQEIKNIFDFKFDDIKLVGYEHHEPIKAQVAV